jgi:proline iminopeptidase
VSRQIFRGEVFFHFFRGEQRTFDWFGDLDRIRCPTLILAGELDPMTTVLDHEEMAAAIRGSQLEVFRDAGHGVFRDRPDEALTMIRDFVRTGADAEE